MVQVTELNQMLVDNKPLEAFEKFYHPNVVMQDNHKPATVGKDANRERERKFYGSITELRRNTPIKVAVGNEITMVEWLMDFTHTEWGCVLLHQISVQVWEGAQIIKENFFYSLK
ncbi:MAG: SnoaL-like domain-containing protein [Bacteroidota bacterium]